MKVMNLIRRNRRSPEYSESGVGNNCLLPLACRLVLARHVAVVCRRRSPSEAVALVIRAHSVKTTAASELSLRVINTREFYIGCSGLVMIAILVEPRNRVRARTAVRWCVVMWVWRRTACWCRLPTQNASPKRRPYRRNRAQFQPVPAVHFERQVWARDISCLLLDRGFPRPSSLMLCVNRKNELHCSRDEIPRDSRVIFRSSRFTFQLQCCAAAS